MKPRNNIFNQFDPSSNTINHSMLIMITMFLILSKPTNKNSIPMIISLSTSSMKKEIQTNMSPNNKKMSTNLLSNSLIQISLMNLTALSIYSWSVTSQPNLNLPMILSLWTPILIFSLSKKKKEFLTHLTPQGTPIPLIPLMFLIELSSFFIRPLTLILRLTANMIAGHTMILLCSSLLTFLPKMILVTSIPMIILSFMELMIAILQAYIISTLISLYISEM